MQDLILEETPSHTIVITGAEHQAIYDANEPDDIIAIQEQVQDLIRSRQVDLTLPYHYSLNPPNIWRGDEDYHY